MPDITPQVAPIGDSTTSPANAGTPTIDQIMSIAGLGSPQKIPNATVPVHQSNPNIPQVHQFQPNQIRPVEGSVADKKYARHRNAMADATNAIGKFTQQIQERKVEQITHDAKTIMDAQSQIDNANRVISDPNTSPADKANAQAVLGNNKKVMDRILSDPKKQKALQKAFDVSYTDPEKNNKPEVKGMLAGLKAHLLGQKAGTTANNPEEKRLDQVANGEQQPQRKMITAGDHQSATPYADQFLKQQPTGLAENPAYDAAVKAQEKKQEALLKAVPTIIAQEGANQRNAATNAEHYAATVAGIQSKEQQGALARDAAFKRTQLQVSGQIQKQLIAGKQAMDRLQTGITMRENIITKKGATPQVQNKLNLDIYKALNTANSQATKDITALEAQKKDLESRGILTSKAADGTENTSVRDEIDDLIRAKKEEIRNNTTQIQQVQARLGALGTQGVADDGSINNATTERTESNLAITDGSSEGSDSDETDPDALDQ